MIWGTEGIPIYAIALHLLAKLGRVDLSVTNCFATFASERRRRALEKVAGFLENCLGEDAKLVCPVGEVLEISRRKTGNCLPLG